MKHWIDPENFDLQYETEAYLDRCGLEKDSPLIEARNKMQWGTFGKNGDEKFKWVLLCECSTNHLNNIFKTQNYINKNVVIVIHDILLERGEL